MDSLEEHRANIINNWESLPEDMRQMLESVGQMYDNGHPLPEISASLDMPEHSVRNALKLLGKMEHDPDLPFPERFPELQSFLENFGQWPQEEPS